MPSRSRTQRLALIMMAVIGGAVALVALPPARHSSSLGPPYNPVGPTQGFLLVSEGNAELSADESEGPAAIGGNLRWGSYNVIRGTALTPVAPGDAVPMALLVAGTLDFADSTDRLQVNDGYFKLGDPTGASVLSSGGGPPRVVAAGQGFDSTPAIGVNVAQSVASVTADVPDSTFDFAAAFEFFRAATADLGACASTVTLRNRDNTVDYPGNVIPTPNTPVSLALVAGQQNVLTIDAASLANINEITFRAPLPSSNTPLLINVITSGLTPPDQFTWVTPNTAGIGGAQAPFMLWNFPTATSIVLPSGAGATIEGTVYAPNADLQFLSNRNIEGNVIVKTIRHADGAPRVDATPRELHYFPFDALLEGCSDLPPTSTTSTTTTSTSTTTTTSTSTTTTTSTSTTSTTSTSTTSTTTPTTTTPDTAPEEPTTTTAESTVAPDPPTTTTASTTTTTPPVAPTTTDSGVLPPGPTVDPNGSLPATGSDGTGTLLGLAGLFTLCGVVVLAVRRPRGRSAT